MTALDIDLGEPPMGGSERDLLGQVDPALLVACLVQMTGDAGFVDRYAPAFTPTAVRSALSSHVVAPAVAAEVAARLPGWRRARHTTMPLDGPLFQRLASFAVGEPVDDEFLPILEEQAGFVPSRRVLPVTRQPPSDFQVIVIGAGMVGINAGVKLAEAGFSYHIFESRSELGGTWSINRYPGAAVDTPSHYYSYSFELNPGWSHFYPVGDEYLRYLTGVAAKHGVTPHISFDTAVLSREWNDYRQRWMVETVHKGVVTKHEARAVITALGFLNRPLVPDFPGRNAFGGVVVHSAEWDPATDLHDKNVLLVGAGCTAVQIATAVAESAATVTVLQRQPHWVAPAKATQGEVPSALRWALTHVPNYHEWFRLKTYWYASDNNYLTPRIDPEWQKTHTSVSPANAALMRACLAHIDAWFGDQPALREQLVPDFPPYA